MRDRKTQRERERYKVRETERDKQADRWREKNRDRHRETDRGRKRETAVHPLEDLCVYHPFTYPDYITMCVWGESEQQKQNITNTLPTL